MSKQTKINVLRTLKENNEIAYETVCEYLEQEDVTLQQALDYTATRLGKASLQSIMDGPPEAVFDAKDIDSLVKEWNAAQENQIFVYVDPTPSFFTTTLCLAMRFKDKCYHILKYGNEATAVVCDVRNNFPAARIIVLVTDMTSSTGRKLVKAINHLVLTHIEFVTPTALPKESVVAFMTSCLKIGGLKLDESLFKPFVDEFQRQLSQYRKRGDTYTGKIAGGKDDIINAVMNCLYAFNNHREKI